MRRACRECIGLARSRPLLRPVVLWFAEFLPRRAALWSGWQGLVWEQTIGRVRMKRESEYQQDPDAGDIFIVIVFHCGSITVKPFPVGFSLEVTQNPTSALLPKFYNEANTCRLPVDKTCRSASQIGTKKDLYQCGVGKREYIHTMYI